MGHYKSNVRDLEFNLFEVLELEKVLDAPAVRRPRRATRSARCSPRPRAWPRGRSPSPSPKPTATRRPSTPRPTPSSHSRAVQEVARGPGSRASGSASASTRRSAACRRRRWSAGRSTSWSLGANPAVFMYLAGPDHGQHPVPHRQRAAAALGAGRRRARLGRHHGAHRAGRRLRRRRRTHQGDRQPDGTWHIEGVKRFITNGDTDDLFENIMHLVLARPEGAGPGTKGLSLFLVPKFLFDPETGEPGERNGVVRHQPRAQDGPEGLCHLRTHLRPARHPRGRAIWSATCTTASRRCSRSSSTPE